MSGAERIGDGIYRVYWESQHGTDPAGWCAQNDIPFSIEPDPEYTDELWPYQQAYILMIAGSGEAIGRFEAEWW